MHRNLQLLLEQYALRIVRTLVDYPEMTNVVAVEKKDHWRVTICDHASCDQPRLVGRGQRIFDAICTCLRSLAGNERVEVTLAEPIVAKPKKEHPTVEAWTRDDDATLAFLTAQLLECIPHYTGKVWTEQRGRDVTIVFVKSKCLTVSVFSAVTLLVRAAAKMRGREADVRVSE